MRDDSNDTELIAPAVDLNDIEQEAALLELQGKVPNRSILRRKAMRFGAYLFSGTDELASASPINWGGGPEHHLGATNSLVDWARSQSTNIANLIYQFLEDPSDKVLTETIEKLRSLGAIPAGSEPLPQERESLPRTIHRMIQTRIHTKEELQQYVRSIHPSARPEAALRQAIRRLIREGKIQEVAENEYRAIN